MYSALSCGPVPALADNSSGCRLGSDGRSIVTEHRQTSEPDVWAAGDVVRGLNQISVATGEAAAMHNRLAGRHSRPTPEFGSNPKAFASSCYRANAMLVISDLKVS
jgi:pyruvate/2-oxoglutarate dehydrogenase complex dihydrolipoamide dehydrogenase (E3) component